MRPHSKMERGQALVLIAFGMIGLIAATALAIDGGNVYSDRRHAQNAADAAVMATGLTKIRNPSDWTIAETAGFARAAENGYDNNGTTNVVQVYQCDDPSANCNLPSPLPPLPFGGADLPSYYVQVTITSDVPTYLAQIVGRTQFTNSVQAVAHSVPSNPASYYGGQALVATMPGCKDPWPYDPFTLTGTGDTVIHGSGVFVNSNCDNAFTSTNNTTMTSDGGTCVVGGVINNGTVNPPPQPNCGTPFDPQAYAFPPVDASSCPDAGAIIEITPGNYRSTPGSYAGTFPGTAPTGNLTMEPGIYCLNRGISVQSGWSITTDLNGNGTVDGSDPSDPFEGVLMYVPTDGVTFNGGASIHIGAMNGPGVDPSLKGYLLVLPYSNDSQVKIAGNNGSIFVGTILAPGAFVTLEGGSSTDSLNLQCQIIGYSVRVTGNGTLDITYDNSKVGQSHTNPILTPYR